MISTRRISLAAAAAAVFVASLSLALAGERFTNLKVLSKSTTKDQMKKIMKGQSEALGVDCDFCHDENDMASDDNEHKKIGVSNRAAAAFEHKLVERVLACAEHAAGVGQFEVRALPFGREGDDIAGRAGNRSDDRSPRPGESVEER